MNYENLTTDELVFKHLGIDMKCLEAFDLLPAADQKPMKHLFIMEKAIEAINGPDFKVDIFNTNQLKTYLWPDVVKDDSRISGFGFSYGDWTVSDSYALAYVGSRRLFENRDKARHFWKYFSHHFEGYIVPGNIKE